MYTHTHTHHTTPHTHTHPHTHAAHHTPPHTRTPHKHTHPHVHHTPPHTRTPHHTHPHTPHAHHTNTHTTPHTPTHTHTHTHTMNVLRRCFCCVWRTAIQSHCVSTAIGVPLHIMLRAQLTQPCWLKITARNVTKSLPCAVNILRHCSLVFLIA